MFEHPSTAGDVSTGSDGGARRLLPYARATRAGLAVLAGALTACGGSTAKGAVAAGGAAATTTTANVPPSEGLPPSDARCAPTGLWAPCSVLYRLDRAGLAPTPDTGAAAEPAGLSAKAMVVKIGLSATLDVYLYPDSASRIADEQRLDRAKYLSTDAPQTMARERSLIENANLVALLTSLNDHQRERVGDALGAGPPQPPPPPVLPAAHSSPR